MGCHCLGLSGLGSLEWCCLSVLAGVKLECFRRGKNFRGSDWTKLHTYYHVLHVKITYLFPFNQNPENFSLTEALELRSSRGRKIAPFQIKGSITQTMTTQNSYWSLNSININNIDIPSKSSWTIWSKSIFELEKEDNIIYLIFSILLSLIIALVSQNIGVSLAWFWPVDGLSWLDSSGCSYFKLCRWTEIVFVS